MNINRSQNPFRYGQLPMCLFMIIIMPLGCMSYPEISPKSYEICKALYSACNQQDAGKIKKLDEIITDSLSQADINAQEADWLSEIVSRAESGDWQWAQQETREIMEDQIR